MELDLLIPNILYKHVHSCNKKSKEVNKPNLPFSTNNTSQKNVLQKKQGQVNSKGTKQPEIRSEDKEDLTKEEQEEYFKLLFSYSSSDSSSSSLDNAFSIETSNNSSDELFDYTDFLNKPDPFWMISHCLSLQ